MHFAAPIWLALLLPPWTVLAVWLAWTRYSGTRIPFLELWRGPVGVSRGARWFRFPPLAVVALVAAILLAVFAASRPFVRAGLVTPVAPALAPATPKSNLAITHVAAVERPRAQVMVTVRNDAAASGTAAAIDVRSGEQRVRREIAVPRRGLEASFFIDCGSLGETVDVALQTPDEVEPDNRATLVRRSAPPRVEVRGDVPPEVRRVAEAYSRARPAAAGRHALLVAIPPGAEEVGVIVATDQGATTAARDLLVASHPVTADVDFARLSSAWASDLPAGNWTPVASVGGKPIVAVRETPARQVWMGFESSDFARTPSFVVLWTNAINWVAGGGQSVFVSSVPAAANGVASATPQAAVSPTTTREIDLAPWTALLALSCVFFASLTWSAR